MSSPQISQIAADQKSKVLFAELLILLRERHVLNVMLAPGS